MLRSLKVRLTVLYVGIFSAFLIAFSWGVYTFADTRGFREFDRNLERDAQVYARLITEERREVDKGGHSWEDWLDEVKDLPELMHASSALFGSDGKIIFATADFDPVPTSPPEKGGPRTEYWRLRRRPGDYRVLTLTVGEEKPPMTLEFARSTRTLTRFLDRMKLTLVAGVPVLMALASIAGFLFVRRSLKPVDQMAGLAREISAGDLARRIPIPGSEGELRQLAITFNDMLSRLEESFARMQTFTANAAHELQTPVATIRSALETSIGRPPAEVDEAIRDALEDLVRLAEITQKLLLLAKADAGRLPGIQEPVDLAEIAGQVASAFEAPAGTRRMTIRLDAAPSVTKGDAALLRRAIHNLVENAVKYGREGGEIRIRVGSDGVEVRNEGPTISASHLPRIFDPFFRVDPARSDRVPGSGLGLAVVKAIVEAHGGSVRVESTNGVTSCFIFLPGLKPSR